MRGMQYGTRCAAGELPEVFHLNPKNMHIKYGVQNAPGISQALHSTLEREYEYNTAREARRELLDICQCKYKEYQNAYCARTAPEYL